MTIYKELDVAIQDMQSQNVLYQPSSFWADASEKIVGEICTYGIDKFRSLPKPLGFFVPSYGSPGNSFNKDAVQSLLVFCAKEFSQAPKNLQALDQFLSGYNAANADYRVLQAADDINKKPYLHRFSESSYGAPVEQWAFDGKKYSRSALNYALGLTFLKRHIGQSKIQTVIEIGGGFGTLGELLLSDDTNQIKYIDIDIPPTSFVAQQYLTARFGSENVAGYASLRDKETIAINALPKASVMTSWQIEKLTGNADLFVNFISFQEMEPEIVQNYLNHVDRLQTTWILLRNMREGKQIYKEGSHVGVKIPIKTDDYLNMLPNYTLVEKNVVPFGYKTVDGFHSELVLLKRKG